MNSEQFAERMEAELEKQRAILEALRLLHPKTIVVLPLACYEDN